MAKTSNNGTAIRPQRPGSPTTGGKRIVKWSNLDTVRDYVTNSPTASSIAALLQDADDGEVSSLLKLDVEIRAKDPHIQGLANTRQLALTALDWAIEPAELPDDDERRALAEDAAGYVAEVVGEIANFDESLEHLATAIGPNLSVVELLWEKGRVIETVDVPGHRLCVDPTLGPEVRVETDENPLGVECEPGKFIVYTPNANAGFPMAVNITRALAWSYLLKHFAKADWSAFCELFGAPIRVGSGSADVTQEAGDAAIEMLRNMSADSWAYFSEGIQFQLVEANRGTEPFSAIVDWIERKQSIIYLGQTLTTEQAATGSFAMAKVHDNVRADLLLSDIKKEARCLRDGLIRPLVQMRWPKKRNVPMPRFVRQLTAQKDIEGERLALDQLTKAMEFGLEVDEDVKYNMLGIPKPVRATEVDDDGEGATADPSIAQ